MTTFDLIVYIMQHDCSNFVYLVNHVKCPNLKLNKIFDLFMRTVLITKFIIVLLAFRITQLF